MSAGPLWHLRLFGPLALEDCRGLLPPVTRFRTQKAMALLATLALSPGKWHTREMLAAQLWPDAEVGAGRNRLKQELSSLRRTLEPPGVGFGTVLRVQGHTQVALSAEQTTCDVWEFERNLAHARMPQSSPAESRQSLRQAVLCHSPDGLLPHLYEEVVLRERERLAALYRLALRQLVQSAERPDELDELLPLWVRVSPADPQPHEQWMRRLLEVGDVTQARQQFARWQAVCEEAGQSVSPDLVRVMCEGIALPSIMPAPAPGVSRPRPALYMPLPGDRFIGRQEELHNIVTRLLRDPSTRLVTVTGPGGCGKTRLCLEAAALLREKSAERAAVAAFVELADAVSPAQVLSAVLAALMPADVRPTLDSTQAEAIGRAALLLRTPAGGGGGQTEPAVRGRTLLFLDNFEQVAAEGAGVVVRLLALVPNLVCVVTSRQPLQVAGEQVFTLMPLPVLPAEGQAHEMSPAAQLFCERARAASPGFAPAEDEQAAIANLCRELDGLPLAIEIAAARAAHLSPQQILARVREDRFGFLVSSRRDVAVRQSSLFAAVNASYCLLPPPIREHFARLGIFRARFSPSLAARVCVVITETMTDVLQTLCEQSLVTVRQDKGGPQYLLLETLRAFALSCLSPEQNTLAHRALTTALYEEAAHWVPRLFEGDTETARRHLEAHESHIRAALTWAARQRVNDAADFEAGMHLAARLCDFWHLTARHETGLPLLRRFLTPAPNSPVALNPDHRSRLLRGAASLSRSLGEYAEARTWYEQALRELSDRPCEMARTLRGLSIVARFQGRAVEAHRLLRESLRLRRGIGETGEIADSLLNLGLLMGELGRFDESDRLLFECQRQFTSVEDAVSWQTAAYGLTLNAIERGEWETADTLLQTGLDAWNEWAIPWGIGVASIAQSRVHLARGDVAAARAASQAATATLSRAAIGVCLAQSLEQLARCEVSAARSGQEADLLAACRAFGAAQAWRRARTVVALPVERGHLMRLESDLRNVAGTFADEWFVQGAEIGLSHAAAPLVADSVK